MKNLNLDKFKKIIDNGRTQVSKNVRQWSTKVKIALAMASVTTVLTACGGTADHPFDQYISTDGYTYEMNQGGSSDSSTDMSEEDEQDYSNSEDVMKLFQEQQDQINQLTARLEAYESSNDGVSKMTANDTFSPSDWEAFVEKCRNVLAGKINNENAKGMETAFLLLNIDYLDENAKEVLISHFGQGQDIESELNKLYSVLSQVREHNTEIDTADNYLSYVDMMLDEKDQSILSVLDGYAKEVITLNQNLTDANKKRVQEIFEIISKFSDGTGTIKVTINGKEEDIAQIHLSHGGIFAAENIAQDISVLSRNIVSQEKREKLDENLRSRDTLAKTQEIMNKYFGIASTNPIGISAEEQEKIVKTFNKYLEIISKELSVMGISEEETKSLLIIMNIDYFMDSANTHHAFDVIYNGGIDIDQLFKDGEAAIEKMVQYNDKQGETYDMMRIVMDNESDAVVVKAFAEAAAGVNSKEESVKEKAVNIVKGFNQFSSEVTVDYEDENGVSHSIDKNGISKGATQVINWYTYYNVLNHKTVYDKYANADSIIELVDGKAIGLNTYDQLVLMVTDYCAENNIAVFDYEMGQTK